MREGVAALKEIEEKRIKENHFISLFRGKNCA